MIKLYGMGRSNYFSIAKACLVEKGMAFEEIAAPPSQDDDYLAKSPMGKIPCIETEQGFLSEAFAIADYLDSVQPHPRLLPEDAFARAKAIELCRHLELDIELVARRCLPAAFFGAPLSEEVKASTEQDLARGTRAVDRLLVCGPYAAGAEFCLADIYAFYCLGLAGAIVEKIFGTDLLDSLPRARELLALIGRRPSIQQVEAEKAG